MSLSYQTSIFDITTDEYNVRAIPKKDAHFLLLNVHYLKRLPPMTYAFGLFEHEQLVGVVTYGTPPSYTLMKGICGEPYAKIVLELNRLVLLNNKPNEASRLVGASLKLLPKPSIVVSFADTAQNHEGIIYQATNFIYTGLSAKFKQLMVKGFEGKHPLAAIYGLTVAETKLKYGAENCTLVERSRKHRYVKFVGNKTQIKEMRAALKYKVLNYPKPINQN